MSRKKIGLALGGGGARGLAHIGVLKVLEREGIPIDIITGTSMGGLIGAVYSAGVPLTEIEKEVLRLCKPKEIVRLMDPGITHGAMLKGSRIYKYLEGILGQNRTFDTLPRRLALTATDLISGCEIILQEGLVVEAIRATISFPGVFLPVRKEGLCLVDGGVLNNVPADVARQMGADIVIAVDVLPDFSLNRPGEPILIQPISPPRAPRPLKELWHIQIMMISAATRWRLQSSPPELVIRPDLPADMDLFIGFRRPRMAIEAGVRAAASLLSRIQSFLENGPVQ